MPQWSSLETLPEVKSYSFREAFPQGIYAGEGFRAPSRRAAAPSPRYIADLSEAAKLVASVLKGSRYAALQFQEAMSTSDFPILFGDILDRQVLASYTEWPSTWDQMAQRSTVRDFRDVKLFRPLTGAQQRLDVVDELEEYPEAPVNEQTTQSYRVKKYGRRMAFSWETLVNDDLDMFRDIPQRFGVAARRTEDRTAVELYVDVNGPHASLYTVGNKNQIITANGAASNNPPLSIGGLQSAMHVLFNMKDEDGEPILIETVTLAVPPSLEITANNILNALQLEIGLVGQGAVAAPVEETRLITTNWMRNRVKLVVVPYIPLTASTANGTTSWFLFANPSVGRPALRMAFLRGHEQPEIFMKTPNARRVGGGGEVDPMNGDFDTDAVTYKVRHVLTGVRIDPKATVASNGSGS